MMKNPKQNNKAARVLPALVPSPTIKLKINPKRKPKKFPIAKRSPTAEPSPTGKASSHPNSSIIGTKGIKKNELKADMKEARNRDPVLRRG